MDIISEWLLRCGMEINSALALPLLNCGAYKVEKAAMSPFKAKDITRLPVALLRLLTVSVPHGRLSFWVFAIIIAHLVSGLLPSPDS